MHDNSRQQPMTVRTLTRRRLLQWTGGAAVTAMATDAMAAEAVPASKPLRVMTFNIWHGGTRGGTLEQTAQVIKTTRADLVGLQEVNGSGERLAKLCGMHWHDQRDGKVGILSRFPIVANDPKRWGAQVELPNGRRVWLMNGHLQAAPYQPYQLARIPYGKQNPFITTETEAIAEALRARGAQTASLLMSLSRVRELGEPVFLTGDFNEPSHLDWTKRATVAKRCRLPVAWPTSRLIAEAGFADSYRDVHSDEVKRTGWTWTPRPAKQDVPDRIDFVYHIPRRAKSMTAEVVGESNLAADVVLDPYPSDHRAVICQFSLPEPASSSD